MRPFIFAVSMLGGVACASDVVPPQVHVSGDANAARRADSGTLISVGQAEIQRYGERSLAEVLKRQPGITLVGTPARGTEIRMRGLGNGYTQILLDGQPAPAGFSVDTLAPELVERIEIQRVATADVSSQAIAGSINIILKKAAGAARDLKLGLSNERGRAAWNGATQWSGRRGAAAYTLAANASDTPAAETWSTHESGFDAAGAPLLARRIYTRHTGHARLANLAPRLNWSGAGGDTVTAQLFSGRGEHLVVKRDSEQVALGQGTEYPRNASRFQLRVHTLRGDSTWTRPLGESAKLSLTVLASRVRRDGSFDFDGMDAEARLLERHLVDSGSAERGAGVNGKLAVGLAAGHELALGWDLQHGRRDEFRYERMLTPAGALVDSDDSDHRARLRRSAVYLQDEWKLGAGWSAYLGLRWERLATHSDAVRQRFEVLSPILQTQWKLTPERQFRLAVARTYKAPAIGNLIPRRYTVDNNNSAINPDQQGNPGLRPELAWGVDGAYEHYVGKAMFSASVFARRIDDVIGRRLDQVDGRWVDALANVGQARVRGVELEAKLPWRRWELRANLARNWSRLDSVPGPDNRLDRQVPASATLGADYRHPDGRLSGGASFGFQGGGPVRLSARQYGARAPRRTLELYGVAQLDGATRLRVALANLLHQDDVEENGYADQDGAYRRVIATPGRAVLRLTLERRL